MTKSERGERGSSSSSVSSNNEFKKARMNEEEEETNSLRDINSKFNGEYGKQLCEAARRIMWPEAGNEGRN